MTTAIIIGIWSILAGGVCAFVAAATPPAELGINKAYVRRSTPRLVGWAAFCAGTLLTSIVLTAVYMVARLILGLLT